jgi:hypothetical protein
MATPKRRGSAVSSLTRLVLWARGAGRCYICNKQLIGDLVSGAEDRNFGFVAHIVGEAPGGPRGDPLRSMTLADDVSNLMLLCHVHHKLIDVDQVDEYPESRLLAVKQGHERRIEMLTDLGPARASHVLRYAANIGSHQSPVPYPEIAAAMFPERYPAEGRQTIDIQLSGTAFHDGEERYWEIERENLRRQYQAKLAPRLERAEILHLSVFALAPQPLLVELGRLLGDITPASIHQKHREPTGWRWAEDTDPIEIVVDEPAREDGPIALILGLSATIDAERITRLLGTETCIWTIKTKHPHNDIMRGAGDLTRFRKLMRNTYNRIKARHGSQREIHIFPAVPVSAAVEIGRTWMPKADLPLEIYDENRTEGGFKKALRIQ